MEITQKLHVLRTPSPAEWLQIIKEELELLKAKPLPPTFFHTLKEQICFNPVKKIRPDAVIHFEDRSLTLQTMVYPVLELEVRMTDRVYFCKCILLAEDGRLLLLTARYLRFIPGFEGRKISQEVLDYLALPGVSSDIFSKKYPEFADLAGARTVEEATVCIVAPIDDEKLLYLCEDCAIAHGIAFTIAHGCVGDTARMFPSDQSIGALYDEFEGITKPYLNRDLCGFNIYPSRAKQKGLN